MKNFLFYSLVVLFCLVLSFKAVSCNGDEKKVIREKKESVYVIHCDDCPFIESPWYRQKSIRLRDFSMMDDYEFCESCMEEEYKEALEIIGKANDEYEKYYHEFNPTVEEMFSHDY